MARKSGVAKIDVAQLSLPDDADALASLEDPETSGLENASEQELKAYVKQFRELWIGLSSEETWVTDGLLTKGTDHETHTGGFWKLVNRIGVYYSYCLFQYAACAGPAPAIDLLEESSPEIPKKPTSDNSRDQLLAVLQSMTTVAVLSCCDACAWGVLLATQIDNMDFQSGELPEKYDADLMALRALAGFRGVVNDYMGELQGLCQQFFKFASNFRIQATEDRAKRRQKALRSSVSYVSPKELTLLGERHQLMIEKYGTKRVERVFEQQLALIFQSFGFTVVPARPGDVGADLLCIAREQRFSFLVDAKSSRNAYALPKTDQRAIAEYASEYSAQLPDLPALAFVLLVGNGPAGTVERKLRLLEADIGVPVRFMPVNVIARLRQGLPGPILPAKFKEAVVGSDPVLNDEIIDGSKQALDGIVAAYTSFVDGLKKNSRS